MENQAEKEMASPSLKKPSLPVGEQTPNPTRFTCNLELLHSLASGLLKGVLRDSVAVPGKKF